MAEAALLCWLAPPARSLAGQVTAVAPLALFHDLRWIYGYDRSWAGFAVLLAAVLGIRSALNTALARLAWPRNRAQHPAWRTCSAPRPGSPPWPACCCPRWRR